MAQQNQPYNQQYNQNYSPYPPSTFSEVGSAVSTYCQARFIGGAIILLIIALIFFILSYRKVTTEESVYLKADAIIASTFILSGKQRKGTKNNYYYETYYVVHGNVEYSDPYGNRYEATKELARFDTREIADEERKKYINQTIEVYAKISSSKNVKKTSVADQTNKKLKGAVYDNEPTSEKTWALVFGLIGLILCILSGVSFYFRKNKILCAAHVASKVSGITKNLF